MQLVKEIRVDDTSPIAESFTALPGRIAGITCSVLQADSSNTLQLKWGDAGGFRTFTPLWVPDGFNGAGYVFGGPAAGEIFAVEWGGGAGVFKGTIRFWDEPVLPFGACPLATDSSTTLASGTTSTQVHANCMGAWLTSVSLAYIATESSDPQVYFADGTVTSPVFQIIPGGSSVAAKTPVQFVRNQIALVNDFFFKTKNNGVANMTYYYRMMGFCGA